MSAPHSPRRSLRAVSAVVAVAALVACSDASGPAAPITSDQAAVIGQAVASEVATSMMTFDPADLDGTGVVFQRMTAGALGGALASRGTLSGGPLRVTNPSPCPILSEDPPTDADADGVPDDVTLSFVLPNCHVDTGPDAFVEVTGGLHISDPNPDTPALAYNLGYNAFSIAFQSPDTSFSVTLNGTQSASVTETGLSQTRNLSILFASSAAEAATLITSGSASFTPAEGQTISIGDPLPAGLFSATENVAWQQGGRNTFFGLVTDTPLDYDPSCLDTGDSPFRSGEVRAIVSGTDGRVYIRVTWQDCGAPQVSLVGTTA
jgi:hypothetical protein